MGIYVGVDGKARKVKTAYVGVDEKAEVIYKSGIVPDGYIPVYYIYNNHNAINSIDTEIKPNSFTRMILQVKFDVENGSNTYKTFAGVTNGDMTIAYWCQYGTVGFKISCGQTNYEDNITTSKTCTIDINRTANKDSYYKEDGHGEIKIFTNLNNFNNNNNIILFAGDNKGVQLYSCAIYQSMLTGTLSKYYIPCMRISDGKVGMWEDIGKTFEPGSASDNPSYQFSNGPIIEP